MTPYRLRRLSKRLHKTSGNSMLEAALITPLLLLLTFGLVEFSSLLYVYLALQNGVSQATRYAVTGQAMPGKTPAEAMMTAMRDATPTLALGNEMFTFAHMSPGGSTWIDGAGGPGDVGKVTVTYTWKFFTPLMAPFFAGNKVTMKVESAMKNETKFTE